MEDFSPVQPEKGFQKARHRLPGWWSSQPRLSLRPDSGEENPAAAPEVSTKLQRRRYARTPSVLYDYRQQVANASLSGRALLPGVLSYTVGSGNLTISWPAHYLGWRLQTQTNTSGVGLGTNWVTVPGSTTNTSMAFPMNTAGPPVFLRLVSNP